ncbi:MAG: hypothetical protein ACJ76I_11945 [Gaiellaceae bacterium]
MDERERKELIEDLVGALEQRHSVDGGRLLELMRAEQNLLDTLAVVRREIDLIVRGAQAT